MLEKIFTIEEQHPLDVCPLVVCKDRYGGSYSGAKYTAWNMEPEEMPMEIFGNDPDCRNFWYEIEIGKTLTNTYDEKVYIGKGSTLNEAVEDLYRQMRPVLPAKEKAENMVNYKLKWDYNHPKENAKKISGWVVDHLLESFIKDRDYFIQAVEYWQQVKQEIEKL